jgi:hypothetical protein
VLRQLEERKRAPKGRQPARGVDIRPALRWFLPEHDPMRPEAALARLRALVSAPASDSTASLEAFLCFNIAMASCDESDRRLLSREIFDWMLAADPSGARIHWLRGLVVQQMVVFQLDLMTDLIHPDIVRCYDPADHLFNLALSLEVRRRPPSTLSPFLAELRSRCPVALGLTAYVLVVRLGALPGSADAGRAYLEFLQQEHADFLTCAGARPLASYAQPLGYVEDFVDVLLKRGDTMVNLLALFEAALSLVARGELRRRRRRASHEAYADWTKDEVSRVASRFSAWGLAHDLCRLGMDIFDERRRPNPLARDVAWLVAVLSDSPAHEAFGDLFVNELFVQRF